MVTLSEILPPASFRMPPASAPERSQTAKTNALESCQAALGYTFRNIDLLQAALTHTSGANTRQGSNERMEFLGDSVLGLVVCEALYNRFPEYQEGDLTKVKSVVVSRKTCAQFSRDLGLGQFLILGKGVNSQSGETPVNILADVFEALVAAIFLDGGWDSARAFLLNIINPAIDKVAGQAIAAGAKSLLQTLSQKQYGTAPRYVVLDEQGPDHDKCFKIAAEVNGQLYPPVWGRNKKEAEANAALNALAVLQGEEIPYPTT